jgi:predicted DNA-binding ribbon-helix-helix protein
MVSTGLTRARRSQAALALDPIPASKVSLSHSNLQNLTSTTQICCSTWAARYNFRNGDVGVSEPRRTQFRFY